MPFVSQPVAPPFSQRCPFGPLEREKSNSEKMERALRPFIAKITNDELWLQHPNTYYKVPRWEFDDPVKVIEWIEHLLKKNWVDRMAILELLEYIRSPKSKIKLN